MKQMPTVLKTHARRIEYLALPIAGLLLFTYSWLDYRRYFPPFTLTIQMVVLLVLSIWMGVKLFHRQRLAYSPLALPMVAFLAATTVSTFFSIDVRRSFDGLLTTLTLVLAFFLVCDLLVSGWKPQTFVGILLFVSTLALAFGLWTSGTYYWEWWETRLTTYATFPLEYRLFGVFDHPNFLASMLNLALPFAIIHLATAQTLKAKIPWAIWLLAYDIVLFLTRSRGAMVAAFGIVGIMLCWLLLRHGFPYPSNIKRWFRATWRIWITTLFFVGLYVLLLKGNDIINLLNPSQPTTEISTGYSTNAGKTISTALQGHRMALWRASWEIFQDYPFTGSGPLTFAYRFVEKFNVVRIWVPSYAHSIYFEILGCQGVLGILSFAWVLLAGTGTLLFAWWKHIFPKQQNTSNTISLSSMQHWIKQVHVDPKREDLALMVGVCAAMTGFLIHSLVDIIGILPTNHVFVVMLAAVGMSAAKAVQREATSIARWTLGVAIVPLILLFLLVRYSNGQDALLNGVLHALDDDWQAAAQDMDQATQSDPSFVFYYGERGYAYGMLALPLNGEIINPKAYREALKSYAIALHIEPAYVPNLLNMVLLLDHTGVSDRSRALLEEAVALPQSVYWSLARLMLAERYAANGNTAEAEKLLDEAFRYQRRAPEMAACQQSSFCQSYVSHRIAEESLQLVGKSEIRILLNEGKAQEALALLQQNPPKRANTQYWVQRADAHIALGQLDEARYVLRIADTLRYSSSYIPDYMETRVALSHAKLSLAEQKPAQAIAHLESIARPQLSRDGYSYGIFRRVGLPGTFLPPLDILRRTADDLEMYRLLAQLYSEQGDDNKAIWAQQYADTLENLLTAQQEP